MTPHLDGTERAIGTGIFCRVPRDKHRRSSPGERLTAEQQRSGASSSLACCLREATGFPPPRTFLVMLCFRLTWRVGNVSPVATDRSAVLDRGGNNLYACALGVMPCRVVCSAG